MDVEKNLLITILKLSKDGPFSQKLINKLQICPFQYAEKLLKKLQNEGLINLKKGVVEADSIQRLKIAVKAISLGADPENVSSFLLWQEFENIAAVALTCNNYSVAKNVRFKHAGRKWEIDIVACRKPIALCLDCKHWSRGMHPSALKRIVEEQVERTLALSEASLSPLNKIECALWDTVKFVPAVLSLVQGKFKFYDNVPIVPILQLQDFLVQLPAYLDELKHFTRQSTN
jgi:Holliday junction resolvase-like predicted endonuclease